MAEQMHCRLSPRIVLTALSKEQLVDLLTKVGSSGISMSALDVDIASGMTVNDDGTVNLIHYAAWLLRESSAE